TLAAAIRKIGEFDLVMLGRESGDWGVAQTGGLLAEELGAPCVSFVDHIDASDDGPDAGLIVKRQTDNRWEKMTAKPPLAATTPHNKINVPRIPQTPAPM